MTTIEKIKKNIKPGMRVRLLEDLARSIKHFGGSTAKRAMQGTIQEVYIAYSNYILIINKRAKWSILYEDIVELLDKEENILISEEVNNCKPLLFDPVNLIS